MNEKALKIVNSLITSELIADVTSKTNVPQKDVVQIAIEISGRIIGDEENITRTSIDQNIKNLVQAEELKKLIRFLNFKYQIPDRVTTQVVGEMLPSVFRNFLKLDRGLFLDVETKKEVKALEEVKPILKEEKPVVQKEEVKPIIKQEEKEPSMDRIFSNIEKKASEQFPSKQEKKKLFSIKKKEKKEEVVEEVVEEKSGLSLIEKICMIVVGVAFVALVVVLLVLFLKQRAAV